MLVQQGTDLPPRLTSLSGLARQTNRGARWRAGWPGLILSGGPGASVRKSGMRGGTRELEGNRAGRSGGEGSGVGLQGPGGEVGGAGAGPRGTGLWSEGARGGAAEGSGLESRSGTGPGTSQPDLPGPEPRTCALGARLRPHGRRRGLAGLPGQGARLAPARPVRSARRRLLQPRAGRGRAAGAGVATHELAAAGRHQVSGGARAAGVRGCSRVGRAGGRELGRGRPPPHARARHPTRGPTRARSAPWTPVTRLRRNRGCGA